MATYITKTQVSATDRKKFTFSAWIKRSKLSSGSQNIYESFYDANNRITLWINSSDQIRIWYPSSGSTAVELNSSQLLRDCNAWYHIVLTGDTTQSTQADRMKLYINGSRVTAWGTNSVNLSLNQNLDIGTTGYKHNISRYGTGSGDTFFGLMSHIHLTDGYAYDASAFGETDSTTGEWKIKTSPSVTYGSNGFFILKDGNSTTDHSGNSASFTTSGTLTKTEDCPSNVFATGNIVDEGCDSHPVFSKGNNSYSVGSAVWRFALSTLGMSSGKFYMEQKRGSGGNYFAGVTDQYDNLNRDLTTNKYAGGEPLGVGYYSDNGNKYLNNNSTSFGNSYANGDIVGTAIDVDNGYVYFSKNGVWQNSGDPTSGSSGTGGIALPTSSNATGVWFFCPSLYNGTLDVNYGNGYFGTTAVSSAGTNASGIGIFEYDVPTGYTALSTKGLNE